MTAILLSSLISLAIGVAVSYYFSNRKRLSCLMSARAVLDPLGPNLPSEVKIVFSGRDIDKLTEWKFALWNSGNQTILGTDVAELDPLKLVFMGHTVLKIGDIILSRPSITAEAVGNEDNEIKITFNYLDRKDGLGFTIYTCPNERANGGRYADLQGSILGIPHGPKEIHKNDLGDLSEISSDIFTGLMCLVFGLGSIVVFANIAASLNIFDVVDSINEELVPDDITWRWMALIGSGLFALFCTIVVVTFPFMAFGHARPVPRFIAEIFDLNDRFSVKRLWRGFLSRF